MSDRTAVPFLDVGASYRELRADFDAAAKRVLESGWFLLGPELAAFEQEYADYIGVDHAVGVGCGLDALVLSLKALDIGPGDEVIVPSNTYIATWLAVSAVGATPVPVEPDERSYCIEADAISAAITRRTTAVMPVALFGMPLDMRPILDVADQASIAVVTDAAQAHGGQYHGLPFGRHGDAAAWSFYPSKNLGAFSDGGAVTTNDPQLAARLRRLRNYGSEEKYVNLERGMNSRLDELQAAFLRAKLVHLDDWNSRRFRIADRYSADLRELPLQLPERLSGRSSAWHLFVIRTGCRDKLKIHLDSKGIQTLIHYPIPPHRQSAYSDLAAHFGPLPIADVLAAEVLSLPIGPHLTDDQVDSVISAMLSFSW